MKQGDIAVIGWGSLLWDLEVLEPHVRGAWRIGAGPVLPLEFSRISPKRLGSLVVIADAHHGAPCATHCIASRRATVAEAAQDLAKRERAPAGGIGRVDCETGLASGCHADVIAAWCQASGLRGAVWTDLPANFEAVAGRPFSVEAGIAYLRTLTGPSLAEALRYINGAPAATLTPLRRALAADPWWTARS